MDDIVSTQTHVRLVTGARHMKRQILPARRIRRLGKALTLSMPLSKEIEIGREIARLLKSAPGNSHELAEWRALLSMRE